MTCSGLTDPSELEEACATAAENPVLRVRRFDRRVLDASVVVVAH